MNEDDVVGPTTTMQQTRPASPLTTYSGGLTSTKPAESTESMVVPEVAGDPAAPMVGESVPENEEMVSSAGESTEMTEASAESLAAESGAESAVSDLRGIEGFQESAYSESAQAETGLAEVGSALGEESAEFLPFLAALVPTLASSFGPALARGIKGKLSPKARSVIAKLPKPNVGPGGLKPGSVGSLLAQLAKLLESAPATGTESAESVDESVVVEAAAVIEAIIGTDDRVRITNTSAIPWRRICALRITFQNGVYRGTGFFIGPRALATAGHCVYLPSAGGWAKKIEVIPGSDGQTRPFGSVEATRFRSVAGWVNSGKPESDYGCIQLPPGAFQGRNLGSFGFGALSNQELLANSVVLAGYPGDKPFAELWGMSRKIKTAGPLTLGYDIDTMGGQSGSGIYIKRPDGSRTVVGIHNYGSATRNSATRITPAVMQRLVAWSKL